MDFFPSSIRTVSCEDDIRFHQDMSAKEQRYKENWSPSILADFHWMAMKDATDAASKR